MSLRPVPRLLALVLAALATLAGCPDDVTSGDAAADAGPHGSPDGGLAVAPPDIPWLADGTPPIMLAPCPDGWREVHGGTVAECDPYPAGGADACDDGQAHFPGEPGCRPIGEACPPGDYAASLPSTGLVLYVNEGAAAGGDGTLAAPFATLSEVPWPTLMVGTTVALGKGTHAGGLTLKAGVSVIGACTRDTVVTGVEAPALAVVTLATTGEPALVQNMTIRAAPVFGALVIGGGHLVIRGVMFDQMEGYGFVADGVGTEVTVADVVIRNTIPSAIHSFARGLGIQLQTGAHLDASRMVVANNRLLGISAVDSSSATLLDTVIRDTRPVFRGANLGNGLGVASGSQMEATRVLVAGNSDSGALVLDAGSVLTLTDAIIRDTEARGSDGYGGWGLDVTSGAELFATRLLLADNRDVGLFLADLGTRAELTDAVVRSTKAVETTGAAGRGIGIQDGAHCRATRLLVSRNSELGVFVTDPGSAWSVTDGVVEHTGASMITGERGTGVWVQDGAGLTASRLLIADNRLVGIGISDEGSSGDLSDVVIRDTRPIPVDGRWGRGLQAQEGARVTGARIQVERHLETGVTAYTGATMDLEDVSVHQVAVADCATSSCSATQFGYGVGAYSAALSLTRFQVSDAAICGVMVAPASAEDGAPDLDLEMGVVTGAAIGACIQVDDYDIDRLSADVRYEGNRMNIDVTTLPVPGGVDRPVF